jgi:hypothetical protein
MVLKAAGGGRSAALSGVSAGFSGWSAGLRERSAGVRGCSPAVGGGSAGFWGSSPEFDGESAGVGERFAGMDGRCRGAETQRRGTSMHSKAGRVRSSGPKAVRLPLVNGTTRSHSRCQAIHGSSKMHGMIRRNTVLVLGAGASIPYGFPSARDLRSKLCQSLSVNGEHYKALQRCGFSQEQIFDFTETFRNSQKYSIDSFLCHRREFTSIGKTAIAVSISSSEQVETIAHESLEDNWYRYLWNHLSDGSWHQFDENRLKILTFNYDRSLECFLHRAMIATYGRPAEECAKKLDSVPILHLHGSLGKLWGEGSRPYRPDFEVSELKRAAESIRVVGDSQSVPIFETAMNRLSRARRILFLGFSFDSDSMFRLGFPERVAGSKVFGTCYGLGTGEIKRCCSACRITMENLRPLKCQEFLKSLDWTSEESMAGDSIVT